LLKEINPDVICTQETQRDIAFDSRNQIEIINSELGYPHSNFSIAEIKHTQKGVSLENPIEHGLGILSKFPFEVEVIPLTKDNNDKEQRIIIKCEIDIDGVLCVIANLHFSNSDVWAEKHFKETLSIFKENKNLPILVGDFNIFNISKYRELYSDSYQTSSDLYDYTSYPKDNGSLDYILLPHKYKFESFSCRDEYVSDHRMIVAKINL